MKHFLLFYDTAPDYLERRARFRSAHLEKAWAASASGHLVLGGAMADTKDGALLLFKAESAEFVENFAKTDPYVLNGVVTAWRVKEWNTVAGDTAINPVKP